MNGHGAGLAVHDTEGGEGAPVLCWLAGFHLRPCLPHAMPHAFTHPHIHNVRAQRTGAAGTWHPAPHRPCRQSWAAPGAAAA
eukprot:366445-Chlamydomonas_euryale.AAC.20